jgi:hypothetical protein
MAASVLTDCKVVINSVNLSTYVRQCQLNVSVKEQEVTAMGGSGYVAMVAGLKDWTLEIDVNQDFGTAAIDQTLWPLFGLTTTVTINPTSGANSATNPQYSGTVLVSKYTPLDGKVGDVSTIKIPLRAAGPLSRAIV